MQPRSSFCRTQDFKAEAEAREQEMVEQEKLQNNAMKHLKSEAKELESGLKMLFLKKEMVHSLHQADTVMVNYQGYLLHGDLFDTNIEDVAEEAGMLNPKKGRNGRICTNACIVQPRCSNDPRI